LITGLLILAALSILTASFVFGVRTRATPSVRVEARDPEDLPIFPPIPPFAVGATQVTASGVSQTVAAGRYRKITASGGAKIILTGGTYYADQLVLSGGSSLVLPEDVNTVLFIKSRLDLCEGSVTSPSRNPASFQIFYSGATKATLCERGGFCGTVYAPNAMLDLSSASEFYGSFTANSLTANGSNIRCSEGLLRDVQRARPVMTWTAAQRNC
jgi:hypothetical protein